MDFFKSIMYILKDIKYTCEYLDIINAKQIDIELKIISSFLMI